MIYNAVVLHNITLVGEHLIVFLSRIDKVGACPVLPVYKVAAYREGVESVVVALRIISREIEHDVEVVHLYYLCIASDDALCLVGIYRVALIAFPFLEVVRECYAYALCLHVVGRVDATGIIEHNETLAQSLGIVAIDGALVLHELLPPLNILIVDTQQRFV